MPNIEALTQLYRVVENAPDELLHMNAVVEQADCGTARCALGWCLVDPWFQQNTLLGRYPGWDQRYSPDADFRLAEIFDISVEDFDNLFAMNADTDLDPHAVPKNEVLDNIHRVLNGQRALMYAAIAEAEKEPEDDDDDED